jgi:hypothetical protein
VEHHINLTGRVRLRIPKNQAGRREPRKGLLGQGELGCGERRGAEGGRGGRLSG